MGQFLSAFASNYGIAALYTAVVSYLLGSLNFAIIITRYLNKDDIRNKGSGNAGFSNVLRSVGILPAVFTFIGDFIKVIAAVIAGRTIFYLFGSDAVFGSDFDHLMFGVYIAGLFCLIGHIFPLYFGFKGGKGVVTACGMLLMCDFRLFLIAVSVFAIVFIFSRIISLSSLTAAVVTPIVTFIMFYLYYLKQYPSENFNEIFYAVCIFPTFIILVACLIIIFRHRDNIIRLIKGQEKKIRPKEKVK